MSTTVKVCFAFTRSMTLRNIHPLERQEDVLKKDKGNDECGQREVTFQCSGIRYEAMKWNSGISGFESIEYKMRNC